MDEPRKRGIKCSVVFMFCNLKNIPIIPIQLKLKITVLATNRGFLVI